MRFATASRRRSEPYATRSSLRRNNDRPRQRVARIERQRNPGWTAAAAPGFRFTQSGLRAAAGRGLRPRRDGARRRQAEARHGAAEGGGGRSRVGREEQDRARIVTSATFTAL